MALNQLMHPRNIYKTKKPDFKELAIKNASFRATVSQDLKGRILVDFKNPRCLKALTCALLQEDFDLAVDIPEDRLIPAVPQRLNYILWVEDLLEAAGCSKPGHVPVGIDVGTGSSCIFPLLGAKLRGWRFYASEIDVTNLGYARENVIRNGLHDRIKVVEVDGKTVLSDLMTSVRSDDSCHRQAEKEADELVDFCMCNPPFFGSVLEAEGALSSSSELRTEPSSCSSAADVECIADGGDEHFVKRMIDESIELGCSVRIYTSMLGKKSSLGKVKAYLREKGITNFMSTAFCQGRTMRWALAWTHDSTLKFPKSHVEVQKKQHQTKPPLTCLISGKEGDPSGCSFSNITQAICSLLSELEMSYIVMETEETRFSATVSAWENTWSHQRRKRRQLAKGVYGNGEQAAVSAPSAAQVLCTGAVSTEAAGSTSNVVVALAAPPVVHTQTLEELSCSVAAALSSGAISDSSASGSALSRCRSSPLIRFMLTLTPAHGTGTVISVQWLDGQNRELMHQVMQFLRNRLQNQFQQHLSSPVTKQSIPKRQKQE